MTSVPVQPGHQVAYVTQEPIINVPSNAGAEKYASAFFKLGVSITIQTFAFYLLKIEAT